MLDAGADPAATAADGITTPLELARRRRDACNPTTDGPRIASYDRIITLLSSAQP